MDLQESPHSKQSELTDLSAALKKICDRTLLNIGAWKILGIPALLMVVAFVSSVGNASLFTIEDRIYLFLYCAPFWVAAHITFIVTFDPVLKAETELILTRMREVNYQLKVSDVPDRGLFEYGFIYGLLFSDYTLRSKPAELQITGPIRDYIVACAKHKLLPHSRNIIRLQYALMLSMFLVLAVVMVFFFSGRIEGGHGFSFTGYLTFQFMGLSFYVAFMCGQLRELALIQALAAIAMPHQP